MNVLSIMLLAVVAVLVAVVVEQRRFINALGRLRETQNDLIAEQNKLLDEYREQTKLLDRYRVMVQ